MSKSLWSRSVWNSLFNRVSGSRRLSRRRSSLRTNWKNGMPIEALEQRVVLAASSPVAVTFIETTNTLTLVSAAGNTNETVVVKGGATFTDVLVNGKFNTRLNGVDASRIDFITFSGGGAGAGSGAADSLSVSGITTDVTITLTDVEKLQLNSGNATVNTNTSLALLTSEVSGTLTITSTAGAGVGAITQTGKVLVSGKTTITATGNSITLKTAGNSFGDLVLDGVNITINEDGPTNLGGAGAVVATGTLTVTSTGAISDSAAVTVDGATVLTSYGSSITISGTPNFKSTLTLKGTDISLENQNATDTELLAVTATGSLTVTSTGLVSHASGNITVGGNAKINAGTGGAGALDITLTAGSNNFGSLELDGKVVQVTEKSATDLNTTTTTGALTVISSGEITDSGVVMAGGATVLTATGKAITLDSASTFSGTVKFTGADVTISDADGTTVLAGSVARGDLNLTSGGTVDQSGAITVSGLAKITATTNIDFLTNGTGNKFGSFSADGVDVSVKEFDATNLSTSTVTGNLVVTTGGAVTDSGILLVTGTTVITATGKTITLDDPASTFGTTVSTFGSNVAFTDSDGATSLAANTATGSLTVTTTGSGAGAGVSQTATLLSVTGRFTVNAINAGTGVPDKDITLNEETNVFGSVGVFGQIVQLTEAIGAGATIGTKLNTSETTGNFTLVSRGAVTDTGDLKIVGVTDIKAENVGGGTFFNIILDSPGSTFTDTDGATDLVLNGLGILVADHDGATTLGAITAHGGASGTLSIITAGGDITDGGAITVPGKATFNANGGAITIDNVIGADAFTGAISLYGAVTNLTTGTGTTTLNLGNSSVTTLNITSVTAIIDSGTLNASGAVTISADGAGTGNEKDVTLDSPLNTFGTITLTLAEDVNIVEFEDTDLGAATVATLKVKSAGEITNSRTLVVSNGGAATGTDLTANGGAIELNNTSSTFAGTIKLKASGDITITDADVATLLGLVNTPGNFSLTAGDGTDGAVTQSGGAAAAISVGLLANIDADTTIALTSQATNNFGALQFSGSNVDIRENSGMNINDLATSDASGTLTLYSGGNVVGTGVVTSGSTTDLKAADGNGTIDLANTSNDFGNLKLLGSTVTVQDLFATQLNTGTIVLGALKLTSGGDVTEESTIKVTGLLTITTTSANVVLSGNNELASILINAIDVTIKDNVGSIVIGDALETTDVSNITGFFTLTSAASVTDEGILKVTGTTTIVAAGGNITLDEVGSTFATVKLTGLTITVYAYSDIDLGFIRASTGVAPSSSVKLRIIATGNITDSDSGVSPDLLSTGLVDIQAVGATSTSTLTLNETRSFTGIGTDTLTGAGGQDIT